jgi:hypothetical protein
VKLLWIMMAALLVATGLALVMRGGVAPLAGRASTPTSTPAAGPAPGTAGAAERDGRPVPAQVSLTAVAADSVPTASGSLPSAMVSGAGAGAGERPAPPDEGSPGAVPDLADLLPSMTGATRFDPGTAFPSTEEGSDGGMLGEVAPTAGGEPIPFSTAWPEERVMPGRMVRTPDGSMVLDGRFRVTGSGTQRDPYVLPWSLIESAQETYNPRLGKLRIPQRLAVFDGTYVRISGYIAFPITTSDPKEMLVMLNQWDGCCIGVPPTAYDAIEVRLLRGASTAERAAVHGTLTGRFKIEPYEDSGWLLGLYILDEGELQVDH